MNRFLRIFGAAAVTLSLWSAPTADAAAGKTVYLKDFLASGDAERDAVPAVRAALEHCLEVGASRLVLPGGTLRMLPDRAAERYQYISNNSEGMKRIAFDLRGLRDFEIDGAGTELLFSGFVSPFSIEECEWIEIHDLKIDYTRTFHSEGIVRAAGDGWLEVSFPGEYRCEEVNGCLHFYDERGTDYPYSNLLEFDAVRREPAFRAHDYWIAGGTIPARRCGDGNWRIYRPDLKAAVGNVMVFGATARLNPGFTIADSRGVTLCDVALYHCGGMGVIAQRSRDIALERMVVTPAPGKDRMVSITADATHYVNCGGYIRMIDCVFENQKDDATNIHGLYMAVERVEAPDRALLRWCNSGQYGVDFLREGMEVELVDNRTVAAYARRTVKSVRRLNSVYTEVTFTEPLPDGTAPKHVVAADEGYPDVEIRGCRMRGNRARGLLLGSRGRIVVEDNYFHIAGAAILFEGDANYWFEQSGVRDVVIRGNLFENGNYGCPSWGAACIAVGSGIPDRTGARYHRNILVEGNTFRVSDPRIVHIYSVDGFRFTRDNVIEHTDEYPCAQEEAEAFVIDQCDRVEIESPEYGKGNRQHEK